MDVTFTTFSTTTFGTPSAFVLGEAAVFSPIPTTTWYQNYIVSGIVPQYLILLNEILSSTTINDVTLHETVGTVVTLTSIPTGTTFTALHTGVGVNIDEISETEFYEFGVYGLHFLADQLPVTTTFHELKTEGYIGITSDWYPGTSFDSDPYFNALINFDSLVADGVDPPDNDRLTVFAEWGLETGGNIWIQPYDPNPSTVFYSTVYRGDRIHPLRFKRAESPMGGDITLDNLAPMLDYVPVSPIDYSQSGSFVQSRINGLVDNYIPPTEALFSNTFYRGFYVRNDSLTTPMTNVDFWVNGGEYYTVNNLTETLKVPESRFLIEAEENNYGYQLSDKDRDYYMYGGRSRTSLFGQVNVSYLVRPVLYPFDARGIGVGVNLQREVFVPGNQISRLPDLNPGEYVGIYLRIDTQFSPDFPIQQDYSFFHLRYNNMYTGARDMFPGQVVGGDGTTLGILLPSVYLQIGTDYSGFNQKLSEEVEGLYAKYPPYFSYYQD